ncbi:helix-turn-helix domain-containing protein [Plantactinospora sp. CA-290183]|uniref:helix-turn-helix domain-containing protein n=1 Tax=Plantactinospora sp. CA-290183 TaxID=3240006 RepID=UPI003D8B9DA1
MSIDHRLRFLLDELRLVRTARGVTQDDLARMINWSPSTVAMVETGARKPPPGFWALVDKALQTGGTFERLATELGTPQWKIEWGSAEAGAAVLRSYQPLVVPGLLQTEAYARAVLGDAGLLRREDVARHLAERMRRQEILTRDNPPQLFAVLDEGVLRRPVGGPTVMREQLHALVKAAEEPHIWVHVVPLSVGAYPGLNGPFVVALDPGGRATGYLDNQIQGDVVDDAEEVATIQLVWEAVRGQALPQQQSTDLILKVAETWT